MKRTLNYVMLVIFVVSFVTSTMLCPIISLLTSVNVHKVLPDLPEMTGCRNPTSESRNLVNLHLDFNFVFDQRSKISLHIIHFCILRYIRNLGSLKLLHFRSSTRRIHKI